MKGESARVETGLRIVLPPASVGLIVSRAGLATQGIVAITELIAMSYRGEISVLLHNHSKSNYHIMPGDRVAQLIIHGIYTEKPEEVANIKDLGLRTPRGENGPGSSGR